MVVQYEFKMHEISSLSDLEFEVIFRNDAEEEIPVPGLPFRLYYYTNPIRQKAAYLDSEHALHNCSIVNGRLRVFLDAPRFDAGILKFRFEMDSPSDAFSDSVRTSSREGTLPVQIAGPVTGGGSCRRIIHSIKLTEEDLHQVILASENDDWIITESGERIKLSEAYGHGTKKTKITELEEHTGSLNGFFIVGSMEEGGKQVSKKFNLAPLDEKQENIQDLEEIRHGSALGKTALQEVKTLGGESLNGSGNVPIVLTVGASTHLLQIKVGNTPSTVGVNFKTINGESIFGGDDINIPCIPGEGQGSIKQMGSNATVFGANGVATGSSSTDAKDREITSGSTSEEIISEWENSDPESDKFALVKGANAMVAGNNNLALGDNSCAIGNGNIAGDKSAVATGTGSRALKKYSKASGLETTASGQGASAEGQKTVASGKNAHAEGRVRPDTVRETFSDVIKSAATESTLYQTTKNNSAADAYVKGMRLWKIATTDTATLDEEWDDVYDQNITVKDVYGNGSKWFKLSKKLNIGNNTVRRAIFIVSESEYFDPKYGAKGDASHTEGVNTTTSNEGEHAEGRYNKSNQGTIHSVGIGNADSLKNAEEIMDNGDQYLLGVGGYDGTNPDEASTLQDVVNAKANVELISDAEFNLIFD